MKFTLTILTIICFSISGFSQMTGDEVNSKSSNDVIMSYDSPGCMEALQKAQNEGAEAGCYSINAANYVSKIPQNAVVNNDVLTIMGAEKVFIYKLKKSKGVKIYYFERAFNLKDLKGVNLKK